MSTDSEFIFNIPSDYENAEEYLAFLRNVLGLNLHHDHGNGIWSGSCLGMTLYFDPSHDLEEEDGIPYEKYSSSVSITGSAPSGHIRIVQLQHLAHIAAAICYFSKIDGVLIHECSTKIIHLGFHEFERCLWDYDKNEKIKDYMGLSISFDQGVKF